MKKYKYTVLDSKGKEVRGQMEAPNRGEVARNLQEQGFTITRIEEAAGFNIETLSSINIGGVPTKEKVVFMRQLATMLSSGLPLTQALEILAVQAENEKFKNSILDFLKAVESGSTLSDAMAKKKGVFSDLHISMIRAGEESGNLIEIVTRLADDMEKEQAFKAKVRGAMIYPVIVLTALVLVLSLVMIFMVPAVTQLFEGFDAELPAITKFIVGVSDFMVAYWWIILLVTVVMAMGFRYYRSTPSGREVTDSMLLRLPVLGKFIKEVQVTQFARTMQMLLKSGIPILDALDIVEDSMTNVIYKHGVAEAKDAVEKGSALAVPIAKNENFPILLSRMIGVGEETGKLDEVLGKVADYYEREVDQATENLTKAMEPIILITLGGTVGFVAIAIYMPLFSLGNVIK